MNILYITSSFDKIGSASVRNIGLVNGLIDKGCEVDVLTQDWPRTMTDESMNIYISNKVNIYKDNLKVITSYFSHKKGHQANKRKLSKISKKIREFIKNIYFFPDIDKEWIKSYRKDLNFQKYDLIISSSDTKTSHFIAYDLKKKYGVSWFTYWGDPWKDDMNVKGIKKYIASIYEKRFLYSADANFHTSIPTINSLKKKYKDLKKNYFLPRGYLQTLVNKSDIRNSIIRLCYPGSIYYGRNITCLIEQINEFNKKSDVDKIALDVYGYCEPQLSEKYKNEFISFHNQVSFSEMNKILDKMNAVVILMNDARSHQIPGKLYDFFGTNKTIIAIMPGKNEDVKAFLHSTKRCLVYDADSINLDEVIEDVKVNIRHPMEEYSIDKIAEKLLDVYYQQKMNKS